MTKKLVSLLCVFALCLSFALPVSANGVSVTVDTVTAEQGETVDIPIRISGNTGLAGAQFSLSYANGLRIEEIVPGNALSSLEFTPPGDLTANPVTLMWDGKDDDATNGVLATLKFNVANLTPGEYPISITPVEKGNYDDDLNDVAVSITNGKIIVVEGGSSGGDDAEAVFKLSDVAGRPGNIVQVKLSLKTDSEINSIAVSNINYDSSVLTFEGFSDYEHIEDLTILPPTFDADKMAIVIGLKKAAAFDGDICTLNFKIKDNIDDCKVDITADSITKKSSTVITSCVEAAVVTVRNQILGDIDCNETVDIDDAVLLFQHSMLPEVYPINYVGDLDFDKNGAVDIDDAVLLFQYSMLPDLYPIQ